MRAMAARPFIVFTTQRSGSGWTMDLLGTQEGIRTPGISNGLQTESMLLTHKANKAHWPTFKWEAWRYEAERAFANVVASNPAARAVGWKLMYDQVPQLDRQIVGYHALRDSHGGCYTVRDAGSLTPKYKCTVYAYKHGDDETPPEDPGLYLSIRCRLCWLGRLWSGCATAASGSCTLCARRRC